MTEEIRIIVCGGRKYSDVRAVYETLDEFTERWPIDLLIHGGQSGADTLAALWADQRGVQTAAFQVSRTRWKLMFDLSPCAVLAFPGGSGTEGTVEIARQLGVRVERYPVGEGV